MKRIVIVLFAFLAAANLPAQEVEQNPIAKISQNPGLCSIFHHWGFIGDSLCSGELEYTTPDGNTGYWDCYEYAWGTRMCAIMGVEGEVFSKGGETAKGWIENYWDSNNNKLQNCAKDNPKQAYIIALGANDANPAFEGTYDLGNVETDVNMEDYNKNASTFIGCYAGIIQRLKEMQPEVKIFVVTLPERRDPYPKYNAAIRQMAETFSDVWVIDLEKYAADYYCSQEFRDLYVPQDHGHLTPAGYEFTAWEFLTYIDWIIRNDFNSFKEVGFMIEGAPERKK